MNNNKIANREKRARRKLAKEGYRLRKYRGTKDPYSVDRYTIIDANNITACTQVLITLEEVELFANE